MTFNRDFKLFIKKNQIQNRWVIHLSENNFTSNRKKVLGCVLNRTSNFNMRTFNGRIIFQKTVYLLQRFGLNFGYKFNWYVYGPYSPELTDDGFEISKEIKGLPRINFVNKEFEIRFQEFLKFMDSQKNNDHWLELVASIDFLRNSLGITDKSKVFNIVMSKQTHFKENECQEVWKYLERSGLWD